MPGRLHKGPSPSFSFSALTRSFPASTQVPPLLSSFIVAKATPFSGKNNITSSFPVVTPSNVVEMINPLLMTQCAGFGAAQLTKCSVRFVIFTVAGPEDEVIFADVDNKTSGQLSSIPPDLPLIMIAFVGVVGSLFTCTLNVPVVNVNGSPVQSMNVVVFFLHSAALADAGPAVVATKVANVARITQRELLILHPSSSFLDAPCVKQASGQVCIPAIVKSYADCPSSRAPLTRPALPSTS